MPNRKRMFLAAGVALLALLVMSGGLASAGSSGSKSDARLAVGTPDSAKEWKLGIKKTSEDSAKPQYTISINQPVLEIVDGQANTFNPAVDKLIAAAVSDFKKNAQDAESFPNPAGTSSDLIINYDIFATDKGWFSVKFDVAFYIAGAAHPSSYIQTVNYVLNTDKVLTLADLFKPTTKYLDVLAKYCIPELKKQNRLMFPEGANPTADNYSRWTLERTGILISFDSDQIGPHVQGPSYVLIPYLALESVLKTGTPFAP